MNKKFVVALTHKGSSNNTHKQSAAQQLKVRSECYLNPPSIRFSAIRNLNNIKSSIPSHIVSKKAERHPAQERKYEITSIKIGNIVMSPQNAGSSQDSAEEMKALAKECINANMKSRNNGLDR